MKVSVSIITYNHEKYIAQAIDSVLMQKTNFDVEIIIGEDGSTDKTPEIVKAYKEKYPDKIKLFLNDRSHVIYVDGQATGKWNLNNNIENATGKYVALLEGDDYWTDTEKLQRQVDFLEANPHLSFSFHDIIIVDEEGTDSGVQKLPAAMKKELTREELIAGYYPTPPTASIVYRRKYLPKMPDWFYTFRNGDIVIAITLSEFGNAGYIDEKMSAYRFHEGGVWSRKTAIFHAEKTLKMRKMLMEKFEPVGLTNNSKLIVGSYLFLLKKHLVSFRIGGFFSTFFRLISFSFKYPIAIKSYISANK